MDSETLIKKDIGLLEPCPQYHKSDEETLNEDLESVIFIRDKVGFIG